MGEGLSIAILMAPTHRVFDKSTATIVVVLGYNYLYITRINNEFVSSKHRTVQISHLLRRYFELLIILGST